MIKVEPVALEFNGVRLVPLSLAHADGLRAAASDGELWNIRVTSVPEPTTALIPPAASEVCASDFGRLPRASTSTPASASSMAARRPEPPVPITRTVVEI